MNHRTKPELIKQQIATLQAMAAFGHLDRETYRDTQTELSRLRALLTHEPPQVGKC